MSSITSYFVRLLSNLIAKPVEHAVTMWQSFACHAGEIILRLILTGLNTTSMVISLPSTKVLGLHRALKAQYNMKICRYDFFAVYSASHLSIRLSNSARRRRPGKMRSFIVLVFVLSVAIASPQLERRGCNHDNCLVRMLPMLLLYELVTN